MGGHDVACSVFLARHSAYIDDELMPRERSAHERHQAACASCARYARVLANGVDALRSLPPLEASADFEARLQHRLFHVQDEAALGARPRSSRVWLAAAASLALLVAGEQVLDGRAADDVGPAASIRESARYDASAESPAWAAPAEQAAIPASPVWEARVWDAASPVHSSAAVLLHSPAYSPVVVQPPLYRRVSAVATD